MHNIWKWLFGSLLNWSKWSSRVSFNWQLSPGFSDNCLDLCKQSSTIRSYCICALEVAKLPSPVKTSKSQPLPACAFLLIVSLQFSTYLDFQIKWSAPDKTALTSVFQSPGVSHCSATDSTIALVYGAVAPYYDTAVFNSLITWKSNPVWWHQACPCASIVSVTGKASISLQSGYLIAGSAFCLCFWM